MLADCYKATFQENYYIENGEFHAYAYDVSSDLLDEIKMNKDIISTGISYTIGTVATNNQRLFVGLMDDEAIKLSRLSLIKGRLPENDDEIAMDEVYLAYFNSEASLGDSIKLDITVTYNGKEKLISKSYRLVGIYKNKAFSSLLLKTYSIFEINKEHAIMPIILISSEELNRIKNDYDIQANTLIKCKDEKNIDGILQGLPGNLFRKNLAYTDNMLEYQQLVYKNFADIIEKFALLIIILSVIGILNSFYISVQEREKQLGIIKALGASKKNISMIVLSEALYVSIIGIPVGLLASIGLIKLTTIILEKTTGQEQFMLVSGSTLVKAVLLIFITIIISALIPAVTASVVSPIKIIMGQGYKAYKVKNKKKRFQLIKKPVIIMAVRNLIRQKRRSFMGIIVLVLMVYILLDSNMYNRMQTKILNDMINHLKKSYAVSITKSAGLSLGKVVNEYGLNNGQIDKLKQIKGVTKVNAYKQLYGSLCGLPVKNITEYYKKNPALLTAENASKYNNDWQKKQLAMLEDGFLAANISVIGVNADLLEELNEEINPDDLNSGILYVPIRGTGYNSIDFSDLGLDPACDIELIYYNNKGKDEFDICKIKLTKVVNQLPSSIAADDLFAANVCLLINEKSFKNLTNESLYNMIYIYVDSDIVKNSIQFNDELRKQIQINDLMITSKLEMLANDINSGKLVLVIMYISSIGVIVLAAFIFINSITSSILSRKREFGLLRAVGISKPQINRMVLIENTISCIGAAIICIVLQLLLRAITGAVGTDSNTNYVLDYLTQFPWIFTLIMIVLMVLVSTTISFNSLKKVMSDGIIDSIRYVE